MEIYRPIWSRPPNIFVRYEDTEFDDGHGHYATIVMAYFLDKKKVEQKTDAFVKWHDKLK
jgi:hypothetical protein